MMQPSPYVGRPRTSLREPRQAVLKLGGKSPSCGNCAFNDIFALVGVIGNVREKCEGPVKKWKPSKDCRESLERLLRQPCIELLGTSLLTMDLDVLLGSSAAMARAR